MGTKVIKSDLQRSRGLGLSVFGVYCRLVHAYTMRYDFFQELDEIRALALLEPAPWCGQWLYEKFLVQ